MTDYRAESELIFSLKVPAFQQHLPIGILHIL